MEKDGSVTAKIKATVCSKLVGKSVYSYSEWPHLMKWHEKSTVIDEGQNMIIFQMGITLCLEGIHSVALVSIYKKSQIWLKHTDAFTVLPSGGVANLNQPKICNGISHLIVPIANLQYSALVKSDFNVASVARFYQSNLIEVWLWWERICHTDPPK